MGGDGTDTTLGGARKDFPTTLWSVVLRVKDPAHPDRRRALESLIRAYWKPLYSFVRRKGIPSENAKDLVQGYFASLLERDFLKNVLPDRGRFRSFLLTGLENHMADERDRDRAQKRGGGREPLSLDYADAERGLQIDGGGDPLAAYTRDWALRVLAQAFERLQLGYLRDGRVDEWEAFRDHLSFDNGPRTSYEDLARSLRLSVTEIRNRLHRLRTHFRDAILDVIRGYTDGEDEAKEELRDLFSALSGSPA